MAFDPTLGAPHALPSDTPQKPLALVAVGGCGGRPDFKVMWGGTGNGVYQRLKALLVDVTLLQNRNQQVNGNCPEW